LLILSAAASASLGPDAGYELRQGLNSSTRSGLGVHANGGRQLADHDADAGDGRSSATQICLHISQAAGPNDPVLVNRCDRLHSLIMVIIIECMYVCINHFLN
jgi:hypothetical protein